MHAEARGILSVGAASEMGMEGFLMIPSERFDETSESGGGGVGRTCLGAGGGPARQQHSMPHASDELMMPSRAMPCHDWTGASVHGLPMAWQCGAHCMRQLDRFEPPRFAPSSDQIQGRRPQCWSVPYSSYYLLLLLKPCRLVPACMRRCMLCFTVTMFGCFVGPAALALLA